MTFKSWEWVFLVGALILTGCEAGIRGTSEIQTLEGRIVVPTTSETTPSQSSPNP